MDDPPTCITVIRQCKLSNGFIKSLNRFLCSSWDRGSVLTGFTNLLFIMIKEGHQTSHLVRSTSIKNNNIIGLWVPSCILLIGSRLMIFWNLLWSYMFFELKYLSFVINHYLLINIYTNVQTSIFCLKMDC